MAYAGSYEASSVGKDKQETFRARDATAERRAKT